MKSLKRVYMEWWTGIGKREDAEQAVDHFVTTCDDVPQFAYEFYGCKEAEIKPILRRILQYSDPAFAPTSEKGERIAIEILNEHLGKFLDKQIRPIDLCQIVRHYDGCFPGREIGPRLFEYPGWLGSLWNCCDWCDETWTFDTSTHLVKEAEKVLRVNRERLRCPK